MKHSADTLKNAVASCAPCGAQELYPIITKERISCPSNKTLKAIAALVAAILAVGLCGCAMAPAETTDNVAYVAPQLSASEANTEKPETPAEPTEAPEDGNMIGVVKPLTEPDTPRKIALWTGTEYDFEVIPDATRFTHARMTVPADFSAINTEIPQEVYRFPLNMDALGDTGAFVAPCDYDPDLAADAVSVATNAALADSCVDYRDPDAYRQRAYRMRGKNVKGYEAATEEVLAEYIADKAVFRGLFVTDPSLVYIDSYGQTRVRGVMYQMLVSAERSNGRATPGVWYFHIVEICLAPQEWVAESLDAKPWSDDYHAYVQTLWLGDTWWVVDDNSPDYQSLFDQNSKGVT